MLGFDYVFMKYKAIACTGERRGTSSASSDTAGSVVQLLLFFSVYWRSPWLKGIHALNFSAEQNLAHL